MESPTAPEETEKERLDRQMMELLQELRVAVTGVQVLFAFLLTVPFSAGFSRMDSISRGLFVTALTGAALASIFLIAPAAQHRVLFRAGLKEELVRRSNSYGIAGAAALAVSMASASAVVLRVFWVNLWWFWMGVFILALCAWAWFGQPYLTFRKKRQR